MSTAALSSPGILPKSLSRFIWSVRREMWEHRFLIAAPCGVAALAVAGFIVGWPFGVGDMVAHTPKGRWGGIGTAYDATTFFCIMTGLAVALFYCLEALHAERRDRSILFWKSPPVSDFAAVLAKLAVPMLLLPAVVLAAVMAASAAMLLAGSVILTITGHSAATLWAAGSPAIRFSCLVYALALSALWLAPVYCALLLVSVWARRAPFLWAALPLILADAVMRLVFRSHAATAFYLYRITGWFDEGLRMANGLPIARTPDRFLASPGLWLGIAAAVVFFIVAVRLRRRSAPF